MPEHALIKDTELHMNKKMELLDKELSKVRTGRANSSILDGLKVDYYGALTPLQQVASIATPDARTIVIAPYEKSLLQSIEKVIQIADLGMQPNNDGHVIRLPILPLSEERRIDIAKTIKKLGEESKVGIRKVRQDMNGQVKQLEKNKDLSEDDGKKLQKDIQTKTDQFVEIINERVKKKEAEILAL